jgi:hypothetical protein
MTSYSRWFDRPTHPKEHFAHRTRWLQVGNINDHGHAAATVNLGAIVGDVMVDVAVKQPPAWIVRRPDDVVALARADQH